MVMLAIGTISSHHIAFILGYILENRKNEKKWRLKLLQLQCPGD